MSHHIFVVDDDPAVARLSTIVLELDGFRVEAFTSPVEALANLADPLLSQPRAIVLDLNMPECDGREFYRRARAGGYRSPILILSAYGAHEAQIELGADGSLSKPFDPEDLSAGLRRVLAAATWETGWLSLR
jgi:DNA-binding response OmpR family regulator